jgi:hypothetical protein
MISGNSKRGCPGPYIVHNDEDEKERHPIETASLRGAGTRKINRQERKRQQLQQVPRRRLRSIKDEEIGYTTPYW